MKDLIKKAANVAGMSVSESDLAMINQHSMAELKAEDVFAFKIAMCDNDIDRDFEVFPLSTLEKLASLYVGRTVISNHQARAENQVARIYSAEVVQGEGQTKNNEPYSQLVAKVYMVRTESNKDLITEISAGIKKEVSVGCSISSVVCSICGTDNRKALCKHWPGREYEGQTCYFKLMEPHDAYEVSFVAVPAQPKAGVTKEYGGEKEAPEAPAPEAPAPQPTSEKAKISVALVDAFIFEKRKGENTHE